MKAILITALTALALVVISCQKDQMTTENQKEASVNIDGEKYSLELLFQIISESTGFPVDSLTFSQETNTFFLSGYDLELDPKNYIKSK